MVPPRVKTMAAAAWQVWDSVLRGDTIHIDYDGEYGSEWVLIVSVRAVPLWVMTFPIERFPSQNPSRSR